GYERTRDSQHLLLTARQVSAFAALHLFQNGKKAEYVVRNVAAALVQHTREDVFSHRERWENHPTLRHERQTVPYAVVAEHRMNGLSVQSDFGVASGQHTD